MTCKEFSSLIDQFLDGDLSRLTHDEVRGHAGRCEACGEELERARRLLEAASDLPLEMEPERDLWEGVSAAIGGPAAGPAREEGPPRPGGPEAPAAERKAGWTARPALLAAALILVVAGAGLAASLLLRPESPGDERPLPTGDDAAVAPAAGGPEVALDEAGEAFLQAKQALREAFRRQRGSLSPKTVEKVEENLRIIEEAVSEIQEELGRDPGNPRLERMLVAAQQREVAFLRKITKTAALRQR